MTCNYCESTTIKTLISDTNSTYTYCTTCNESYEKAWIIVGYACGGILRTGGNGNG